VLEIQKDFVRVEIPGFNSTKQFSGLTMPLFYRDGIHRAIGSKLKQKKFFNCTVAALPTEPPMEQKYKYGTELCRDILFKNCPNNL
jgi:hypothetical protein